MLEARVLEVLRKVIDPELGINIVDLGLVYSADVVGRKAFVVMTMTTPGCPMHAFLTEQAREVLTQELKDVDAVNVELVWEPPWAPEMMSSAARKQLGW